MWGSGSVGRAGTSTNRRVVLGQETSGTGGKVGERLEVIGEAVGADANHVSVSVPHSSCG